ncbi:AMP nucleosidase [Glycocaulis profundi]|jgi:hypothetical protein|nr:AMP nucleosidase [Glycocaulis profundi]
MADQPHRITFLAKTFSAAALEFHRGRMAEKGYRMEGRIEPTVFRRIDEAGEVSEEFAGEPMFTVSFVRRED